jgi:hypothetical protein
MLHSNAMICHVTVSGYTFEMFIHNSAFYWDRHGHKTGVVNGFVKPQPEGAQNETLTKGDNNYSKTREYR